MSSVGCDQVLGRECRQWPRNGENESLGFMGIEECVVGRKGLCGDGGFLFRVHLEVSEYGIEDSVYNIKYQKISVG